MKKIVFILFIISLIIIFNTEEKYILPKDSIRFRIIANSNSLDDQSTKYEIKRDIEKKLQELLMNTKTSNESRNLIKKNLDVIDNIVSSKTNNYTIKYGLNFFPKKEYRNVIYPEGNYESLVITIGNGLGNNWWCVLYPPLCFIDDTKSDYDYDLYIKEIFSKK